MGKLDRVTAVGGILLSVSILLNGFFVYREIAGRGNGPTRGDGVVEEGSEGEKRQETAMVNRVVDGDTFVIEGDRYVRLRGADAPEYPDDCLADRAKMRLGELILGKEVLLDHMGTGSFGRELGYLYLGDLFVDEVMVEEGLAEAHVERDSREGDRVDAAEFRAREADRGIWSDACKPQQDPDCVIKGNVRRENGTRQYHLPDCYNYDKIVMSANEGDEWFCSAEEAEVAGFSRARDCPGDR